MWESGDVSLSVFITFMRGSLTSFAYRFKRSPGLRLAFEVAERNGKIWPHSVPEKESSSSRGKRKRGVFLGRKTVRVEVKRK